MYIIIIIIFVNFNIFNNIISIKYKTILYYIFLIFHKNTNNYGYYILKNLINSNLQNKYYNVLFKYSLITWINLETYILYILNNF